jgi:hypothetical protein
MIDRPYFDDCWELAKKLINDLNAAAKRRLFKSELP